MDLRQVVFLWETADGEIAAVLNAERAGDAFLQVPCTHSDARLLEEMIETAEDRLAQRTCDGHRSLRVWANSRDLVREEVLVSRGYSRVDTPGSQEHQFRRSLDEPIPDSQPVPGYTIRSLGDGLELLERCYASGLGFHQGDIRCAVDNRNDPTWYRNIQTAPLYRRDLDIVAVAADGSIASFCTVWYDDVTRTAYYEPVATIPAHQRKGLGKATMLEGLRRLKRMGAKVAFVGGHSESARALYYSFTGGGEYAVSRPWSRRL
jgi:GNAT superfamily N-acetyltransferase